MRAGSDVEVRSRFDGGWVAGFQIFEVLAGAEERFMLRRTSDGTVLPVGFSREDLRERAPASAPLIATPAPPTRSSA